MGSFSKETSGVIDRENQVINNPTIITTLHLVRLSFKATFMRSFRPFLSLLDDFSFSFFFSLNTTNLPERYRHNRQSQCKPRYLKPRTSRKLGRTSFRLSKLTLFRPVRE